MFWLTHPRNLLGALAIAAFAAFGFALFSQHVLEMQPCAWCILQRMICLTVGIAAGVGWLLNRPASLFGAGTLTLLLALSGIVAAWYQHTVAANLFSCDLTFADRFVAASGLDRLLPSIFGIYATCADSVTTLLGVRYELWTLLLFALMAMGAAGVLLTTGRHYQKVPDARG